MSAGKFKLFVRKGADLDRRSATLDAIDDRTVEDPTPVNGEWLHLKEMAYMVKQDLEEDCEMEFPGFRKFEAVLFIKRDFHHLIRVHVGGEEYVDVLLTRRNLYAYQLHTKFNDSLKFPDLAEF